MTNKVVDRHRVKFQVEAGLNALDPSILSAGDYYVLPGSKQDKWEAIAVLEVRTAPGYNKLYVFYWFDRLKASLEDFIRRHTDVKFVCTSQEVEESFVKFDKRYLTGSTAVVTSEDRIEYLYLYLTKDKSLAGEYGLPAF